MIATLFALTFVFLFWVCPVAAAYGLAVQRGRRAWAAVLAAFGLGWVGYLMALAYYISTPQRNRPAATA